MIQYWERFFDNLHETRENLLFEICPDDNLGKSCSDKP